MILPHSILDRYISTFYIHISFLHSTYRCIRHFTTFLFSIPYCSFYYDSTISIRLFIRFYRFSPWPTTTILFLTVTSVMIPFRSPVTIHLSVRHLIYISGISTFLFLIILGVLHDYRLSTTLPISCSHHRSFILFRHRCTILIHTTTITIHHFYCDSMFILFLRRGDCCIHDTLFISFWFDWHAFIYRSIQFILFLLISILRAILICRDYTFFILILPFGYLTIFHSCISISVLPPLLYFDDTITTISSIYSVAISVYHYHSVIGTIPLFLGTELFTPPPSGGAIRATCSADHTAYWRISVLDVPFLYRYISSTCQAILPFPFCSTDTFYILHHFITILHSYHSMHSMFDYHLFIVDHVPTCLALYYCSDTNYNSRPLFSLFYSFVHFITPFSIPGYIFLHFWFYYSFLFDILICSFHSIDHSMILPITLSLFSMLSISMMIYLWWWNFIPTISTFHWCHWRIHGGISFLFWFDDHSDPAIISPSIPRYSLFHFVWWCLEVSPSTIDIRFFLHSLRILHCDTISFYTISIHSAMDMAYCLMRWFVTFPDLPFLRW